MISAHVMRRLAIGVAPPAWLATAVRHHLLPLVLYGLVTLAMTYPLAACFTTCLPGNDFDGWQNVWNFWWTRRALAAGQHPFWTPLLYAPAGAPLYLHTLNLFNGLVSLPVQAVLNEIAAYNTVVVVAFVLNAYFAYLLVSRVGGDGRAGLVGGLSYGFSAYHVNHFYFGQTNLLASGWLPAFVLALLAAIDATGRRRAALVAAAGLALALLMLCDWQYVVFAVLFAALAALWLAAARRSLTPLLVATAVGLLWLALALPLLAPTIGMVQAEVTPRPSLAFARKYSADLLSLVLPSPRQTLWWEVLRPLALQPAGLAFDRAAFLGIVPLALAAVAVRRHPRGARFWLVGALLFGLGALGPRLEIADLNPLGELGREVSLPYALLHELPGVGLLRVPSRFVAVVSLCLAVLVGLALARSGGASLTPPLSQRERERETGFLLPEGEGLGMREVASPQPPAPSPQSSIISPRHWRLATGDWRLLLVAVALLAESFGAPWPATPARVPDVYSRLAASAEEGVLLELPLSFERPRGLFYQTVHGRPLVGGTISRDLDYPLLDLPPFREFASRRAGPDITPADDDDLAAWALAYVDVRWVAVRLDEYGGRRSRQARLIAALVEPETDDEDEALAVYRPRRPPDRTPPKFAVRVADGWYPPEALPEGRRMRWMESTAAFTVWNLSTAAHEAVFRFTAWSFHRPRRLLVLVDGRPVGQWPVGDLEPIGIPLTLAPGQHRVELRALDPPTRPVDVGLNADGRALAFGVRDVALTRP